MQSPRGPRLSRRGFEVAQVLRLAEDDEIIADTHDAFWRRIELHRPARALDADDDNAKSLAEVRFENAAPRERRALRYLYLLHVEIEVVGAGRQLNEVDDRWPQRRLRQLQRDIEIAAMLGDQQVRVPSSVKIGLAWLSSFA